MTPIAPRADAAPDRDHIVRFYDDDSFLCEMVSHFFLEGHRMGASSIVIATGEHRAGIERGLAAGGMNVAEARSQGRLILVDAEETLLSFTIGGLERGVLDPTAFTKQVGGLLERAEASSPAGSVRAYGEMVDLLLRRGNESAMVHLEGLWNDLRAATSFQLYCAYRLSHFDRVEHQTPFETICRLHSHILPAESYDENASPEERRRQVSILQQRARVLETEVEERKKLHRALGEEREHLRDANRRKDEFLAMLSHELRNPLNPILTALDLMDMRGDENSRRERDIIRRQAMHLAGLVEDLLDVSRVTGGKITLRREPMEIAMAVSRAMETAGPLLEQRAQLLQLAVPQRGLLVDADPIRLPQVFANLLTNAAKYTERGGRIMLSAKRDGGEIVVECADNGIGLTPELLETMFEPFVQGTRTLDRAEGGMGLGLALVQSLTQLHGGSVTARSEGAGRGSVFTVRLPAMAPPSRAQSEERAAVAEAKAERHAPARAERVLIVDDNTDCALGFAEVIRLMGHQVEVAFDGPRALQIASRFHPTVALVDIGLPVMDGYQLAGKLRENAASNPLKLVAVTGYGEEANRAMSLEAGFDLHTVKPVELSSLRSLLGNGADGSPATPEQGTNGSR